jgi:hypothetical protein
MRKVLSVFALLFFLSCGLSFGQPDPPPPPGGGGNPGNVPITGIEWLLLGGGILGARKAYVNFKKRT